MFESPDALKNMEAELEKKLASDEAEPTAEEHLFGAKSPKEQKPTRRELREKKKH